MNFNLSSKNICLEVFLLLEHVLCFDTLESIFWRFVSTELMPMSHPLTTTILLPFK